VDAKTIVLSLVMLGSILSLDAFYSGQAGNCVFGLTAEAQFWIHELEAPRLSYTKFQSLISRREVARNNIERVDWCATNFAGNFFSVKLRSDPNNYRVYTPSASSDDPFKRWESFAIPVLPGSVDEL
jgi:hypothetical protein